MCQPVPLGKLLGERQGAVPSLISRRDNTGPGGRTHVPRGPCLTHQCTQGKSPPARDIALLLAALGTGKETELRPWHLDSRLLPGDTSSTPASEGAACLRAHPPPRRSLRGARGVSSLGQEQAERPPPLPVSTLLMVSPTAE